ncbi:TniQ family protein [Hydrogenophaga aromaticivorans]|nr:TniQ family protein [Hydrogenophaga aromaticivorans]
MNLLGIPKKIDFESPASWLSRAALSQGVSIKEFRKFITLHQKADADMAFTQKYVRHVAKVTNQAARDFEFVQYVLTSLRILDRHGGEYLLGDNLNARYRFCPVCLAEQRIKVFALEWRFKAWRWCPLHQCMMRDRCPHCRAFPTLPGDMLNAGLGRAGIATLDRCLCCGELLETGWQSVMNTFDSSLLNPWGEALMNNGRAVLSALACRKIRIKGEEGEFSLSALRRIQRYGLLPHGHIASVHDEAV